MGYADYYTYIITKSDRTISSFCGLVFRTESEAEREAFSEFEYSQAPSFNYIIEKIKKTRNEITYAVYAPDLFNRRKGQLRYYIHVVPVEIAKYLKI